MRSWHSATAGASRNTMPPGTSYGVSKATPATYSARSASSRYIVPEQRRRGSTRGTSHARDGPDLNRTPHVSDRDKYRDNDDVRDPVRGRAETDADTKSEARGD